MPHPSAKNLERTRRLQRSLARWENEGGSKDDDAPAPPGSRARAVPDLTNAELVQLQIRVIALENLMVAQYYHSIPDKKEAMEALARVGLEDRAGHLPSELSGGEQQRVCIARALINYPVLILADEPTGNLDEKNEKLVMNLFRELNEEGHTIITVTHSDHVGKAAKRIVIIEHGHMREGGEEEKA